MPGSLIEALANEVKLFQDSLVKFKETFQSSIQVSDSKKKIAARLDDLENIVIAAAASMPKHVAEKAKVIFTDLRQSIEPDLSLEESELVQLCFRLQSQAEMINKKVKTILNTYNSATDIASAIILTQEEERKRISREIHDGLAQTLASLIMKIDYCLESPAVDEVLTAELYELKDSVVKSLNDIRRFIFDLRPMALDDLGLVPALEQFISGLKKRTGVPVYINVEGERVSLSPENELAVFRVIQEACNNSIKHADPSAVHIFVKYDKSRNRLSIVVKDDGRGFDIEEIRRNYGSLKKLGLRSMEERVRLATGEFEIVSDLGSGTVISFWVPLQ